ncbi:unnamed protein product [Bursaphelenchus xylophilus]|uniref:(pine wood nematode) hypothetical protein n=1 Tax=Bursaphelenchus xylophilus TaxID=6326 RepID=A0A1I7SGA3_BURXY|nr:unnamed protein product [Bursaphelenchus xylophilus]CAG9119213.1 unnamed protein product [Bursaphelenchus xylophilus]
MDVPLILGEDEFMLRIDPVPIKKIEAEVNVFTLPDFMTTLTYEGYPNVSVMIQSCFQHNPHCKNSASFANSSFKTCGYPIQAAEKLRQRLSAAGIRSVSSPATFTAILEAAVDVRE